METGHEWLGAPVDEVVDSLDDFTNSSALLSGDPDLAEKYAQKWVGVCSGEVIAYEDELADLFSVLDREGIPRSRTVVRFIEREQRTLIL